MATLAPVTTYVSIDIDGFNENVIYTELELTQKVLDHHHFNFLWKLGDLKEDTMFQAKVVGDYIGKKVVITMHETVFSGIITEISAEESQNMHQGFWVKGSSPTILLEDGKRSSSYYKKGLSQIFKELPKGIPQNILKTKFQPSYGDPLFYTVQYNETDFDFMKRLAIRYGEWMFYNNTELVIGEPVASDVELQSGVDLYECKVRASLKPLGIHYVSYDGFKGEPVDGSLDSINVNGSNDFTRFAVKGTKSLYGSRSDRKMHLNHMHNKKFIDQSKKIEKEGIVAGMVNIEGHGKHPGLVPGSKIKIQNTSGDSGEYIITEVVHQSSLYGNYENNFKAVPASVNKAPYTNPHYIPLSETQSGIVKENHDPDGLGRVKVQFPWQSGRDMSPWLRIVTTHGGGGKGFHFVPEKDEEVLVGFEGGNAEKPYIAGSMFNNAAKSGSGDADNNAKGITTRSGTTIMFDDKKGSVFISDPGGSSITLKGDGTMDISAPDKINITSKEINIIAENKVNVDGSDNVNITSKEILTDGSSKVTVSSDTKVEMEAPSTLVEGSAQLKLQGKLVDVDGQVITNVKGTLLNLNCG